MWQVNWLHHHLQGAANKSNPLPCFVNISTTNRNFYKENLHGYLPFISTYNCQIILNYHNIWLNYAIAIEATPRFVTHKFYARVIDCSVFVKTTKTANQLKSNKATDVSINLADELVILLIFVNNKHFVNTVTMGKVSHADRMANADAAWTGTLSNLAKAIIHVYKNEINIGHFEHLTWHWKHS